MFHILYSSEIEHSLKDTNRQYLVGSLARPQALKHIMDERLDIGISDYKENTLEALHVHSSVREYQLMLSGFTEYYLPNSDEVLTFKTGDFFVIDADTPYVQKAYSGTRILFIKSSTENDKLLLTPNSKTQEWIDAGFDH